MTDVAYLFPGQGAQTTGMGKSLYEEFAIARDVFHEADEVLGYGLSELCFQGPEEDLHQTIHSQVALLTHSYASFCVLEQLRPDLMPKLYAGLSLGEFSAQVAAGVLSFRDALKVVQARATLMQTACNENRGGMVSIIGLTEEGVAEVIEGIPGYVTIANLNCPGQIVVSGDLNCMETVAAAAKGKGAKLAIILKVAGAFHSSHMEQASIQFREVLQGVSIEQDSLTQVLSNVTGTAFQKEDNWVDLMARQIISPVRFEANLRFSLAQGITRFYELGTGKTLGGMLKRIDRKAGYVNLDTAEHAAKIP